MAIITPYSTTKQSSTDRLPPQNLDAEQSLLGALLLDKDALIRVADLIQSDDFYQPSHGIIYGIMLKLFEKRMPIDVVTLSDQMEKDHQLVEIGGAAYLTNLTNSVPTSAHVVYYAQIIHQKAILRRLISAASKINELGFEEAEDLDTVLDQAEKTIFEVSQKFLQTQFIPVKNILSTTFDRIDELHQHKGKLRGVSTGFDDLDNLLGGLQSSDLIILAGRPSLGKSTLALNIALHAAVKDKTTVGLFSLEESKEQIVDRLLCAEAALDSWKLRTGNLSDDDFPRIGQAMGLLSEAPLFIDDSPVLNVMEIRTKARRLQAEHGLGLLVIDYLQLMEGKRKSADINRVQEISEISRALKALSRELNIPVLALSQLSRAVEARPSHIPILADLRESGSIEQDADVVMFIYREDYYDRDTDKKNIAEILVRKHRNGPTGDIELYFIPEQLRFRNLEKKRKEG
jgi:replicative DNA helicase